MADAGPHPSYVIIRLGLASLPIVGGTHSETGPLFTTDSRVLGGESGIQKLNRHGLVRFWGPDLAETKYEGQDIDAESVRLDLA
jgi:hypothetical protein